jgi:muramoyltetrapeptide carboxypeptidase
MDALAPLGPGAHIRVVAPSGCVDSDRLDRGISLLKERFGFSVSLDLPKETDRYLAGSDEDRLAALQRAFEDRTVDGIWCGRGGYGAIRIATAVGAMSPRPVPLIGFSDLTVLHAVLAREGIRSWHGPVVSQLADLDTHSLEQCANMLQGSGSPDLLPSAKAKVLRPGFAEGPLRGGNLTMLASLAGTPWTPDLRGAIVFLEDVGESVYRLDRCLQQLRHACGLDDAAAVVLGAFTEVPREESDWLDSLWLELARTIQCPVVEGLPVGHRAPNWMLPLGAHAILETEPPALRVATPWVKIE